MVFFQLLHISNTSSPKEIGYFSSLSHIQNAKNILNEKPGFSTNRDGYIVIKRSSPSVLLEKPFFFFFFYYHSEDYSVEYSTTLGFFEKEEYAKIALEDYRALNSSDIPDMVCELVLNRWTLNEVMWAEGFITD